MKGKKWRIVALLLAAVPPLAVATGVLPHPVAVKLHDAAALLADALSVKPEL